MPPRSSATPAASSTRPAQYRCSATRRLIWVRDAGAHKGFADAVKALAATPLADAIVLIEAGDLKKGAALRSAVEARQDGDRAALLCR